MNIAVVVSGRSKLSDTIMPVQARTAFAGAANVDWFASLNEEEPGAAAAESGFAWSAVRFRTVHDEEWEPYASARDQWTCVPNAYSMFLHNKLAFELVGGGYDVVVKWRPDILCTMPLPLRNAMQIDPAVVWVPEGADYGGLNDQVAFGSPAVMRHYCSLIDSLPSLVFERGVKFHPETLLAQHIGGAVRRFWWPYTLHAGRYSDSDRDNLHKWNRTE